MHLRIPDALGDARDDDVRLGFSLVILIQAFWLITLGGSFFVGGEQRLVNPSYAGLRDMAGFFGVSVIWWGGPPILAGLLLLGGMFMDRPAWRIAAYVSGSVIAGSITAAFTASVPQSERAGLTALPTYTTVGLMFLPPLAVATATWIRTYRRRGTKTTTEG